MRPAPAMCVVAAAVLVAGCGGKRAVHRSPARAAHPSAGAPSRRAVAPQHRAEALVTAERANELLVVRLPGGRVARRRTLPPDPENVATLGRGGDVVVVSSRAGRVTVLDRDTLRRLASFGGFASPHIPAISPDGERAYVTDDARGTLTVIRLSDLAVTSRLRVGPGAHHLSFSPDQARLWVALGERAARIAIVDTSHADHPRLVGRFDPRFPAHDLSFSPDGERVWITSATGSEVGVFSAAGRRLLFRVPAGPPPQHLAFAGRYAYVTSGYGAAIEKVDARTGRVLARRHAPYGSFELDAGGGYVVASSLLRGTLAIYDRRLRLLRVHALARAARDVVISRR